MTVKVFFELLHDMHLCAPNGIVVERVESHTHHHLANTVLAIHHLCVAIVRPILLEILNMLIR